jgi:hypothetical protein
MTTFFGLAAHPLLVHFIVALSPHEAGFSSLGACAHCAGAAGLAGAGAVGDDRRRDPGGHQLR